MSTILAALSGWFLGEAVAFGAFAVTLAVTAPQQPSPPAATPPESLVFLHTSGQAGFPQAPEGGFPAR